MRIRPPKTKLARIALVSVIAAISGALCVGLVFLLTYLKKGNNAPNSGSESGFSAPSATEQVETTAHGSSEAPSGDSTASGDAENPDTDPSTGTSDSSKESTSEVTKESTSESTKESTESVTETSASGEKAPVSVLTRDDWAPAVKQALNDFVTLYGRNSVQYDNTGYVVFDFDNTTSIFDVEEQLLLYQLRHMAFALTPENIEGVLKTKLTTLTDSLTPYGFTAKGSYNDWISDIKNAYTALYNTYGPFTAKGVGEQKAKELEKDPMWQEFAAKTRALYSVVFSKEGQAGSYPWVTYLFTGMTSQEVYDLAYASHIYYKNLPTFEQTLQSPDIASSVGRLSITLTNGISVTENVRELMRVLKENGIKVWICSASQRDVIRAGVDAFGLHDYVDGVMALVNKRDANGVYINEFDYTTGYGYVTNGAGWKEDTKNIGAVTEGEGKVTAIKNVLMSRYGHGPLAGFMDSKGDFNFCTEFASLKLVVVMNRANRTVTDGGGLIAALTVYQHDTLGLNLEKANASGDTLYVMQGRNENGLRTFVKTRNTVRFGKTEGQLFANAENQTQLDYIRAHKMSVKDALNTFAIRQEKGAAGNRLGFTYGWLSEYAGYHSVK